ncbi:MAG: hypothetical protein RL335_279 [Bacteroidota bacterium]
MNRIDLNCDMGESWPDKIVGDDPAVMPYISSANIACGYHGGGGSIMKETILLAHKYQVAIGAHPSFNDREGFGRREYELNYNEIYDLVYKQVCLINAVMHSLDLTLHHVKPHGALYNMAAKRNDYAEAIVDAVKTIDERLILYGLAGSELIQVAAKRGLKTCSEVFADRRYLDDGSLTPRSMNGAVIEDIEESIQQVLSMIQKGRVRSITGEWVPIKAETICIHGDHKGAAEFARTLKEILSAEGYTIQSY